MQRKRAARGVQVSSPSGTGKNMQGCAGYQPDKKGWQGSTVDLGDGGSTGLSPKEPAECFLTCPL